MIFRRSTWSCRCGYDRARGDRPLRLTRLTLRRFRSHSAFEADFDGRPVAISGPNGTGKTNILEAITALNPGRGLRGAATEDMAGRPDPIGWSVVGELVDPGDPASLPQRAAVSVDLREGARRQVAIDGVKESQAALGRLVSLVWLTPAMDRLWMEAASERRRFLDRAAFALDPEHGPRAAAYEKAMRERNRVLKGLEGRGPGASEAAWLDSLEERMATAGVALASARRAAVSALAAAQAEGSGVFPVASLAMSGEFEVGPPADPIAFQTRLAAGRMRDASAGRALDGPHRSDLEAVYAEKAAPARDCSTGEQKALLISLVLATARASRATQGRAPLLLLDEVAAHFDPARRAALYEEILALGAHAFLTGAEASLFDALGDRAQPLAL